MRLLFMGTPVLLILSGVGLLRKKFWGRNITIATSLILALATSVYGILGLNELPENLGFCGVCFIMASLFISCVMLLIQPKVKAQFK